MKLAPLLLALLVLIMALPAEAARSRARPLRNIVGTWRNTAPNAPPARLTITRTSLIISRGSNPPLEAGSHFVRLKHSIAITYFMYHEHLDAPPSSSHVTCMFSRLSRDGSRMTQARYDGRIMVSRIKRCS